MLLTAHFVCLQREPLRLFQPELPEVIHLANQALGAMSLSKDEVERLRNEKRHPTLEDDVIVYSGVTILGGDTVIGARSVIGGNVWLTTSVPPDTKVFMKKPELIFK